MRSMVVAFASVTSPGLPAAHAGTRETRRGLRLSWHLDLNEEMTMTADRIAPAVQRVSS